MGLYALKRISISILLLLLIIISSCTVQHTIAPIPTSAQIETSTPIPTNTNLPNLISVDLEPGSVKMKPVPVKACPSNTCNSIGTLDTNGDYEVIGRNDNISFPWYKIKINGNNSGWIAVGSRVSAPDYLWSNLQVITSDALPTLPPTKSPTPTFSTQIIEFLKPGKIVRHEPTKNNPYVFFTYFPKSAVNNEDLIIGIWPHGGAGNNEDYNYHINQSEKTISGFREYSEKFKIPILIMAIPRVARLYVHTLHPGTFTTHEEMLSRPDLKLIDAVWNQYLPTIREAGFSVSERVFMMGFSSPGMFTHRFAMIHPELIKAIWICGEAAAPLPVEEFEGTLLNYPLGVRKLEELSGKPFDYDEYKKIPQYICVGENDGKKNNDTTSYTDIFTNNQRNYIRSRFGDTNPERIKFYAEFIESLGVPVIFKLYKGLGHEISPQMMNDAFNFFQSNSNGILFIITPSP